MWLLLPVHHSYRHLFVSIMWHVGMPTDRMKESKEEKSNWEKYEIQCVFIMQCGSLGKTHMPHVRLYYMCLWVTIKCDEISFSRVIFAVGLCVQCVCCAVLHHLHYSTHSMAGVLLIAICEWPCYFIISLPFLVVSNASLCSEMFCFWCGMVWVWRVLVHI